MRLRLSLTLSLALLALPACIPPGVGAFAPDGFHAALHPYVVHYTDPATRQVLDANWRIDNFELGSNGAPGDAKTGDDYLGKISLDLRGTGEPSHVETYFYDLKLDNRKTGSVIWVQSIPLARDRADRNLSTLMEDYAGALSGSGFFATVDDNGKMVRAKTYAAKILDGKDTKVGDLDAYDAKLELANVDQLKLDPNQRTAVIRVIMIRTNYMTEWGLGTNPTRCLVRVGYYARPGDYDAGVSDFERFVQLLEFKPAKEASSRTLAY